MAINYTKTAWTNGTPPAINHTNLNKLENVAKACADELDALGVESTLADKTTAVGDDQLLARDSADGNKVKKITVANLRASVATATPTASKIPIADESGKLDGWVSDATTSVKGKVMLANTAEVTAGSDISKAITPAALKTSTPQLNGLIFPATQVPSSDPNTLDDYEEGSWTPILRIGGSSTGITCDAQTGGYIKIGGIVHAWGRILLKSKGTGSGYVSIAGLPFLAKATMNGVLRPYSNFTGLTAGGFIGLNAASTEIYTYVQTATGYTSLFDTNLTNTSDIRFSVSFFV